jgi:hypothetical protein
MYWSIKMFSMLTRWQAATAATEKNPDVKTIPAE